MDDVKMQAMSKRTIKPAAGQSRVSVREANSAARVVYRDGSSGRFVIVERDGQSVIRHRSEKGADSPFKGVLKERKAATPHSLSSRESLKKR